MQPGSSEDGLQSAIAPKKRKQTHTKPVIDDDVETPKPKRRATLTAGRIELANDTASSSDAVRLPDSDGVHVSLQEALSELNRPETSSERRDFLLETISSDKHLRKYSDRSLLFKKLVQNRIDYRLLNLHPVPESVSICFLKLFSSIRLTSSSKTRSLDSLFEQLNDCLADGKDQVAELTKVLSSNESSIASHGGYLVFMLRLAALRQLERNGFDDFDTLCYLMEALRQCLSTDIASAISLIADEERFRDAVKTAQAAQVQLALSLSQYGLTLPNAS